MKTIEEKRKVIQNIQKFTDNMNESDSYHWKQIYFHMAYRYIINNTDWIFNYVKVKFEGKYKDRIKILKMPEEGDNEEKLKQLLINEESDKKNIKQKGVYFIGNVFFDPFASEYHYCIKIGQTVDYAKRKKQYATHTPYLNEIDFINYGSKEYELLDSLEKVYQEKIFSLGTRFKDTEWVEITKEIYLEMCEKKFNYFNFDYSTFNEVRAS